MPDAPRRSLGDDSWNEANNFKWYLSEAAGRDVGEAAIRRWVRDHWQGYLRARWIEHLLGMCFWVELRREDFGLLRREFPVDADWRLVAEIAGRLTRGHENLTVVSWAVEERVPLDTVTKILTSFDINCRRLSHPLADEAPRAAMLARAERILRDGPLSGDLLPIPQGLRDAAERDLGGRAVPPDVFWDDLLTATLRHHHAGQRVVALRVPKGVIVLAAGGEEVAAFLAHVPEEECGGATVEIVA